MSDTSDALKLSLNSDSQNNPWGGRGIQQFLSPVYNEEPVKIQVHLTAKHMAGSVCRTPEPFLILICLSVLVDLLIVEAWWFGCLLSLFLGFEHLLALLTHHTLLSSPCITVWTFANCFSNLFFCELYNSPVGQPMYWSPFPDLVAPGLAVQLVRASD